MARWQVGWGVVVAALWLAGCGRGGEGGTASAGKASGAASAPSGASAASAASAQVLLLSPEDLRTVAAGAAGAAGSRGPVITGSVQPEKRADLRAEVSAVVTQVVKDNGEPVRKGELLMRLDDTSIRESLQSADASARAAAQAFDQAERSVQRFKTLQAQGMTSMQALEDAEVRRNSAQSELAAARSRVATAQQQLRRTEVRAPFDGVVSERKASVGDTAQVGKELVKVIGPSSMRFEGLVSADRLHEIKVGQPVTFSVNGFPDVQFRGTLRRIDAAANATTRQVAVIVDFAEPAKAPRVAGLYAEGRAEGAASGSGLMLSDGSIVRSRDTGSTAVWRVNEGRIAKVAVQLGPRDERRGEYPLLGGLAGGDMILRNPGATLVEGQRVEFSKAAATASAGASATGR